MTLTQAYEVLNVSPNAGWAQIEQAYRTGLQALHLQLVPGQPVTVRQKAQEQIAKLSSAFEFLKSRLCPQGSGAGVGVGPPPVPLPQVQPVPITGVPPVAPPVPPPGTVPNPLGSAPAVFAYPWIMPAAAILATIVMLLVIGMSVVPVARARRQETARLRVLCVPWADVRVDGRPLGPSGQAQAFTVKPGRHTLSLHRGNRVWSKTIELAPGGETVVEAQLEKGTIHVTQR